MIKYHVTLYPIRDTQIDRSRPVVAGTRWTRAAAERLAIEATRSRCWPWCGDYCATLAEIERRPRHGI